MFDQGVKASTVFALSTLTMTIVTLHVTKEIMQPLSIFVEASSDYSKQINVWSHPDSEGIMSVS